MKGEKVLKYGLIGSNGRLGAEVINVFAEAGHNLVFEYNKLYDLKDEAPQIIIDCSLPEVFDKTIEFVNEYKAPLIIATTGLKEEHFNKLREVAETVPVVQSFNFSVGIQVLIKIAQEVQKTVPDWDIEISEIHHRFKKDIPSGTAIMMKEALSDEKINISSLRLGNVAGIHTAHFGGLGEVLSITHEAISRRTFAEGILRSANFIQSKKNGLFTFKDVVFN